MAKFVIGMDLGTTYSSVAYYKNNKNVKLHEIIPNDHGNRSTPSCVTFTPGRRFIGEGALHQAVKFPENAIYGMKRLMGRRFNDPEIQQDIKTWPFKVVEENDQIKVEVEDKGEHKRFSPEAICAMILENLKKTAETFFEAEIKDVVITCPANITDLQRQATMEAAKLAGLNVLRMINEPTAAALAYGFTANNVDRKNILVFDFGGGTCDLSILTIEDKDFQVRGTEGDTHLGGEDFDQRMVEHFVKQFKRKYNRDISGNKGLMQQLKIQCEKSKRILSFKLRTEFVLDGTDITGDMTRGRFEELNYDLFETAVNLVETILKEAKMTKSEIDEVILVGGSSKIPKIQQMLSEFFDGKSFSITVDPDEAVALGAAIQAELLQNSPDEAVELEGVSPMTMIQNQMKGFKLRDVCPLSLGVNNFDGSLSVFIERNTQIPQEITHTRITVKDYQTSITFVIYEGGRKMAKDNRPLGEFTISGIPSMLRGKIPVKLTFKIDENGILMVTAYVPETGDKKGLTIEKNSRLSKDDADRVVAEASKFCEEDAMHEERLVAFKALDKYLYDLEHKISSLTSSEEQTSAKKVVDEISKWLKQNMLAKKQELESKKRELEEFWSQMKKK